MHAIFHFIWCFFVSTKVSMSIIGTVEITEKTDSEKTYITSPTTRYRDITDVETTYVVSTDRKLTSKNGSCSSIRNLKRMYSIWIVMIQFIYKIAWDKCECFISFAWFATKSWLIFLFNTFYKDRISIISEIIQTYDI